MQLYCEAVPGPKMYNNVSAGHPMPTQAALPAIGHQSRAYSFPPQVLKEIGFKLVIYPDVLLGTSLRAMNEATQIAQSNTTRDSPSKNLHKTQVYVSRSLEDKSPEVSQTGDSLDPHR